MARRRKIDPRQGQLYLGEPLAHLAAPLMIRGALAEALRLAGLDEPGFPYLLSVWGRRVLDPNCYHSFPMPKKSGGHRIIDAPHKELLEFQKNLHHNFLKRRVLPTPICHSFVSERYDPLRPYGSRWLIGRSIVTNAFAHLGIPPDREPNPQDDTLPWRVPESLFSVDIEDCYPSIDEERIRRAYETLCDEPWTPIVLTTLSSWQRRLPQGAPTSPLLLNAVFWKLDGVLEREFNRGAFRITRYVDDIVLTSTLRSISEETRHRLINIVETHGFRVKLAKICHWRRHKHILRVTGINLHPEERRVALPQPVLERLRAKFFISTRCLERVRQDQAVTQDPTRLYALAKMEKTAVGRIRGIVGFCYMVYGEYLPRRLWSWSDDLRTRERLDNLQLDGRGLTLASLLETIKKDPPVREIKKAMAQIAGY